MICLIWILFALWVIINGALFVVGLTAAIEGESLNPTPLRIEYVMPGFRLGYWAGQRN